MAFEELKQRQAAVWGSAPFEHIASQPGERWLDVATGTGAVAMRAARAGAEVRKRYRKDGGVEAPAEYLVIVGRRK